MIVLLPRGSIVVAMVAVPLNAHVPWLIVDWTFPLPICVVPIKNVIVPVAGFPQLVPFIEAEIEVEEPNVLTAGTEGGLVVVTAGVIVMTVEAAGPAVKLASPL